MESGRGVSTLGVTRAVQFTSSPSNHPAIQPTNSPAMPLLWVVVGVALMLVLMLVVKLDAFLALILTSLAVALLNGMDLLGALQSILKGIGNTMGGVAMTLVGVLMLVALFIEIGAVMAMKRAAIDITGRKHI